jgi:hypothetical protein
MDRIQKVSSYLLVIFNILLVVLPLSLFILWMFMDYGPIKEAIESGVFFEPVHAPRGIVNLAKLPWDPLTKFIGFMGNLVGILPILLGLIILKSIFRNYRKGEIFNIINARQYKYLGYLFFLDALITSPLSNMLKILAVTLTYPTGPRTIVIGFGTPTFESLFCGILVIVISWVMVEGYKLQEDQKFII